MNFGIVCKLNALARGMRITLLEAVTVLLHLVSASVYALDWGVNVPDGGSDTETMARLLAGRNLKSVRMYLWGLIRYIWRSFG